MTTRAVVDVSAVAAILFREPDAVRVAAHMLGLTTLLVPPVFPFELASVARSKVRRHEIDHQAARTQLDELTGWPLEIRAVNWRASFERALATGLTVHDAAYLELASRQGLPLLTLDRELIAAAGSLSLLEPSAP